MQIASSKRALAGATNAGLWLAAVLLLAPAARAAEGAVQCANLIYGGVNTSRCFSDEFLSGVQRSTSIATERRFKSVKLGSDELFRFPFVVMTGESDFRLTKQERENLKRYLTSGGFLLASAGCSSKEWDKAFRRRASNRAAPVDCSRLHSLTKAPPLMSLRRNSRAVLRISSVMRLGPRDRVPYWLVVE